MACKRSIFVKAEAALAIFTFTVFRQSNSTFIAVAIMIRMRRPRLDDALDEADQCLVVSIRLTPSSLRRRTVNRCSAFPILTAAIACIEFKPEMVR